MMFRRFLQEAGFERLPSPDAALPDAFLDGYRWSLDDEPSDEALTPDVFGCLFDKHVSRGDLPLVVDFWAPWCGPCLAMAPFFEKTARQLEPKLRFAKLDTEAHPAPAAKFNIRSIPTMIVFRGGREIGRQSGAMDAASLTRWLGSVVPAAA